YYFFVLFFFQAEDGIRDDLVTGVQTCALPIFGGGFANGQPVAVVLVATVGPEEVGVGVLQVGHPSGHRIVVVVDEATVAVALVRSEERRVGKECRYREWREQ